MMLIRIGNKIINWDLVACTYFSPDEDRAHIYFQSYQDIPDFKGEPSYKRRPDWILFGQPAKDLKTWLEAEKGSDLHSDRISINIDDPHDARPKV